MWKTASSSKRWSRQAKRHGDGHCLKHQVEPALLSGCGRQMPSAPQDFLARRLWHQPVGRPESATGGGLHGANARADPLALLLCGERDRQSGDCRLGYRDASETRSHQRVSAGMPRKSASTKGFRLITCRNLDHGTGKRISQSRCVPVVTERICVSDQAFR